MFDFWVLLVASRPEPAMEQHQNYFCEFRVIYLQSGQHRNTEHHFLKKLMRFAVFVVGFPLWALVHKSKKDFYFHLYVHRSAAQLSSLFLIDRMDFVTNFFHIPSFRMPNIELHNVIKTHTHTHKISIAMETFSFLFIYPQTRCTTATDNLNNKKKEIIHCWPLHVLFILLFDSLISTVPRKTPKNEFQFQSS